MIGSLLMFGMSFMEDIKAGQEKLKQRTLEEYALALKMPRKKKKQAKKSALLLYSIACYNL